MPAELAQLGLVIGLEAFGVGVGTAAFVAFIARTTHPAYTATQFALFTSLAAVPRTFINSTAGWLVESMGWMMFFLLCALLAIPGMLLLFKVAPWGETQQNDAKLISTTHGSMNYCGALVGKIGECQKIALN